MDTGKLRHRVTVHFRSVSRDALGQDVADAEDLTTSVWARIQPLAGQELWHARQTVPRVTHTITLRPLAGLDPGAWIEYRGARLEILSVRDRLAAQTHVTVDAVEIPTVGGS